MGLNLKNLRYPVYRIIEPVTRWFVRHRVHPNLLTTLGFVSVIVAAYFYHQDHVRIAGFFVLLGGLWDVFDGRVARESGLASKFGSFYDSTLDRISEIAVFLGLLSLYTKYAADLQDLAMIYVVMLAMGGSLMVSYTKARAEALDMPCEVGMMQRAERVVLLGLGSLLFGLMWDGLVLDAIIVIMAVLTNLTALQRIVWVYRHGTGVPLDQPGGRTPAGPPGGPREGEEAAGRPSDHPGAASRDTEDVPADAGTPPDDTRDAPDTNTTGAPRGSRSTYERGEPT